MQKAHPNQLIRFGVFEVDLRSGELRKKGFRVKLQDQPLQVLLAVLEKPGEVVTREELRSKLWPADTFVDFEHGLNAAMKRLRDALGDTAENPRYIENATPARVSFHCHYRARCDSTGTNPVTAKTPVLVICLRGAYRHSCSSFRPGRRRSAQSRLLARSPAQAQVHSLAVLPLTNLSGDPQQEYFSDGMTEVLTDNLSKIGSLRVVSRTSAMRYKATKKSLAEIARELNVDGVIEGSVLRSGNRVRITAELIDARI